MIILLSNRTFVNQIVKKKLKRTKNSNLVFFKTNFKF
jgi:hypothetical protein